MMQKEGSGKGRTVEILNVEEGSGGKAGVRAVGPRGVCAGAAVILWREKGPRSLLGGQRCLQQEA